MFIMKRCFNDCVLDLYSQNICMILNQSSRSGAASSGGSNNGLVFIDVCLICMTSLAFVFNGFSLIVLTRRHSNLRFGQIKQHLLMLSLVETVLNCLIPLYLTKQRILSVADDHSLGSIWIDSLFFYNITALTCIRNWIVVVIACSRCEIIFVPLNRRRGLRFSHFNTKMIALAIVFVSYSLSLIRMFSREAVLCRDGRIVINKTWLARTTGYVIFETYCFFLYQSVLPVVTVAAVSLAMSASLLRSATRSSLTFSSPGAHLGTSLIPVANRSRQQHSTSGDSAKRTPQSEHLHKLNHHANRKAANQKKATRTILMLAVVFSVLEVPVFMLQSVDQATELLRHVSQMLPKICNLLTVIDSCSNIVVYLLTSDKFRLEGRRLLWQLNSCQLCSRSEYLSATEHLVINQNNVMALLSVLPPAPAGSRHSHSNKHD